MLVAKIFFNCLARVYARARARVAFAGCTSPLPSLRYGACINLLRKSTQGYRGWFFFEKPDNSDLPPSFLAALRSFWMVRG